MKVTCKSAGSKNFNTLTVKLTSNPKQILTIFSLVALNEHYMKNGPGQIIII